jgi:hypothetical protein
MTAEKTWLEHYIDERIREHEEGFVYVNCRGRLERPASVTLPPSARAKSRSVLGFARFGDSRAEQRHERDILVSATAWDAAVDAQTTAAPAEGREPPRAASRLLRRSGGRWADAKSMRAVGIWPIRIC